MGKYDDLNRYLGERTDREVILDFSTIEEIIGDCLPKSAYKYTAWWSNSIKGGQHPYASSWLDAGFMTRDVGEMQALGKMKFIKK